MTINDPEIVAELKALYPGYEAALMANDADTLTRMFWASPHAMRFGVTENLYGIDEIEAFRKGRSPANLARTVKRLDIVTFGRDFASVTLEFERAINEKAISGRQTQAWVRFDEGWRIVSAHVSVLPQSRTGLEPVGSIAPLRYPSDRLEARPTKFNSG